MLKVIESLEMRTTENYSYHRFNVNVGFFHCFCLCVQDTVDERERDREVEHEKEREGGECFIHFSHLGSQSAPALAFRSSTFALHADLV